MFLSVLPDSSQDQAQRENQDMLVSSLPTLTPWWQEVLPDRLQGLECKAKVEGLVRFSLLNDPGSGEPLIWRKKIDFSVWPSPSPENRVCFSGGRWDIGLCVGSLLPPPLDFLSSSVFNSKS